MNKVKTVAELANVIHQHQTEDYACYFRAIEVSKQTGSAAPYHKVIVVADEGNFVLLIQQESGNERKERMSFRLFTQPDPTNIIKCLRMYFSRYLQAEPENAIVAETLDELNSMSDLIRNERMEVQA
jgi:hypothetical protein